MSCTGIEKLYMFIYMETNPDVSKGYVFCVPFIIFCLLNFAPTSKEDFRSLGKHFEACNPCLTSINLSKS